MNRTTGPIVQKERAVIDRAYSRSATAGLTTHVGSLPMPESIRTIFLLSLVLMCAFAAEARAQSARIHGRVLDSRTGEPIAKATVSIREKKMETSTGPNGEFELSGVEPGEIELYITTVGYALVRKKIEISPATPVELEILLGPEVIRRTDQVTVTEGVFVSTEPAAVSDHLLTRDDMRNLTSVLIDDPLRSVQSLPGVTTGDDFYAQFSARGAGFRSIGYSTDGILLNAPMYEVGDINDGGSLSMLNSDVIESMTLSTGGFSPKYGDRTAGYLDITTRQGNRQKFTNTAAASLTGLSWTSEGPVGKSRKASWLFSARKSYLDWLIDKLTDEPSSEFVFGFKDFFAKVNYDAGDRHQFNFSANVGNSRVDQHSDKEYGPNSFLFGDSHNRIGTARWFWIASNRITLDSAASYDSALLKNVSHEDRLLFRSAPVQIAFKQDIAYQPSATSKIEAGYFARHLSQEGFRGRVRYDSGRFVTTDSFERSAWQPGAYVQDTITALNSRFAMTYGARADHYTATGQNVWMPRASVAFSASANTKFTLAYGQYAQFPTFFQLAGEFANPALKAERATHYTFQVEQTLNTKTRVRVETYNREDRSGIYSAFSEYRLVNGQPVGPGIGVAPADIHRQNTLRGHSRGMEVFLERRSVNNISGWISYSYGVSRFRDAATNLSFDGDFDQRHTFNTYATYRLKPTLNVSMKYRYGSNFPVAAFLAVGDSVDLSEQRSRSRLPAYSRLDIRANKAFNFDRWKLTLFGEVLNLLGRENMRYEISVDTVNRLMSFDKTTMFPRLPIAGLRIEF